VNPETRDEFVRVMLMLRTSFPEFFADHSLGLIVRELLCVGWGNGKQEGVRATLADIMGELVTHYR
jgi:hypothetical protein